MLPLCQLWWWRGKKALCGLQGENLFSKKISVAYGASESLHRCPKLFCNNEVVYGFFDAGECSEIQVNDLPRYLATIRRKVMSLWGLFAAALKNGSVSKFCWEGEN